MSQTQSGPPILNSGFNEMYSGIYCNLLKLNNGFKQCENCNYGNQTLWQQTTTTNEQDCLNTCATDSRCTSYNYNTKSGQNNCSQYMSFPTQVITDEENSNSGYDMTKFSYAYNSLSSDQQNNIQTKCANQLLNNKFTSYDKGIDISNCLSLSNSGNNTAFNLDPECIYNEYQQNNIPVKVINQATYNNNSGLMNNQTDENIVVQEEMYDQYYQLKNQTFTLNQNALQEESELQFADYNANVIQQNNSLLNQFPSTVSNNMTGLIQNVSNQLSGTSSNLETYENDQDNTNNNMLIYLTITLIIFIILFVIYIFKKK